MKEKLELRMYGLVPYNISPIQQGIQYGHAKDEYTLTVIDLIIGGVLDDQKKIDIVSKYINWLRNWKTYIILNGGTTNKNKKMLGTLNVHYQTLLDNDIFCTAFYEPDLGSQLTGVDFIVDERVFNKEDYPDFINWYVKNINSVDLPSHIMTSFKSLEDYARYTEEVINGTRYGSSQPDNTNYDRWVEFIGGKKNVFLRGFLKNFKLA